jgi:hypothetical protein
VTASEREERDMAEGYLLAVIDMVDDDLESGILTMFKVLPEEDRASWDLILRSAYNRNGKAFDLAAMQERAVKP